MLLEIDSQNPDPELIRECVDLLRKGEVLVCPTDTVYAYVCSSEKARAIEKLAKLKGLRPKKAELSLICSDLSSLSQYARQVSTPAFRIMKQALPGPFTFILTASGLVPALFKNKRRTVGIRVPDDAICRALINELGHGLAATSVHSDEIMKHYSEAGAIHKEKGHAVACVIDGGTRGLEGSTVVNLSSDEFTIIRAGKGSIELL